MFLPRTLDGRVNWYRVANWIFVGFLFFIGVALCVKLVLWGQP